MKEKFYCLNIIMLFILFGFTSCKEKKTKETLPEIDISMGLGAPAYYYAYYPLVTFFKDGYSVGGMSDGHVGNNRGWSSFDSNQQIYGKGDYPDSVYVEWIDQLDCYRYEGSVKLPKTFIKQYIKEELAKKEKYNWFSFGVNVAPGGNFCVFISSLHQRESIELVRGVAQKIEKDINCDPNDGSNNKSKEYYRRVGLDFNRWKQYDKHYKLGLGYISKDTNTVINNCDLISKEGLVDSNMWLPRVKENEPYGGIIKSNPYGYKTMDNYKDKTEETPLPVLIKVGWNYIKDKDTLSWFTSVPMPKDFEKRFTQPYKNPQNEKQNNFNHLVFEIEDDNEHCVIWLDGTGKREKLLRFQAIRYNPKSDDYTHPKYAREIKYYD